MTIPFIFLGSPLKTMLCYNVRGVCVLLRMCMREREGERERKVNAERCIVTIDKISVLSFCPLFKFPIIKMLPSLHPLNVQMLDHFRAFIRLWILSAYKCIWRRIEMSPKICTASVALWHVGEDALRIKPYCSTKSTCLMYRKYPVQSLTSQVKQSLNRQYQRLLSDCSWFRIPFQNLTNSRQLVT